MIVIEEIEIEEIEEATGETSIVGIEDLEMAVTDQKVASIAKKKDILPRTVLNVKLELLSSPT